MARERTRAACVAYLRVSTPEQAQRDLSIPAQRAAVAEYARAHDTVIAREYVDAGVSGRGGHRPEFRRMIDDVSARQSDIGTIVVSHTSRFMRDAMEAAIIKRKLRKLGVRVVSACQEAHDDPGGHLVERLFECFDEYESEINGARTAAAMREAVRQGFFPGALPPFGYTTRPIEPRPGVVRHMLLPSESEAPIVRELFRLYVATGGAKSVARDLNRRGLLHRGSRWSKDLVLRVLDDTAVIGTFYWGRRATRDRVPRPPSEWIALAVEPIVEREVYDEAHRVRAARDPARAEGRPTSPAHPLSGFVRCGCCGASYQLETSGKRVDAGVYQYCYYNCRTACRVGKEACTGRRIPTRELDAAVLSFLAAEICTPARASGLARELGASVAAVVDAWRSLLTTDSTVARGYLQHLGARIVIHEDRVVVEAGVPTESENAPLG